MYLCPVHRWAIVVAAGSALVLAWHAAINAALIVPPMPGPMPSATADEVFAVHFAWLRDIAFHDLGVRLLAAWTFLALAGLGHAMTVPVDANAGPSTAAWSATMSTAGRLLIVAGLFGALGQLVELGGHQAAIAASASLAPPALVAMIEFFIDQVGTAIATTAWGLFGLAALVCAVAARGRLAIPAIALGGALLVMVGSRLIDDPADIAGTLLFVTGFVLVPLWALSLLAMGRPSAQPDRPLPA